VRSAFCRPSDSPTPRRLHASAAVRCCRSRFVFDALHCHRYARILTSLGTLCAGYIYSARPVEGAPPHAPSFALFSADDRIHFRRDAGLPTRDDPIADNTAPSSAADLVSELSPEAGRALKLIDRVLRSTGLSTAAETTAALHEQIALSDLRQFAAAENIYFTMRTRGYQSPERLADPANYADPPMPPFLDAYFAQPLRLDYRFEFIGGKPFAIVGDAVAFGPTFESWLSAAVPIEPGPNGRRSFTIFSNGAIHVADGARQATESDPMLAAR